MHGWPIWLVIACLGGMLTLLFVGCACELGRRSDAHLANPREGER